MSLRAKLLFLVIIAVIPAICIEIYGEAELRATRQEDIRVEASRLMRLAVAEQDRINEGARQLLVAFSALPAVHAANWPECHAVAAQILSRVSGYLNIGVASVDGELLCSALPVPAGKDVRRRSLLDQMVSVGDLLIGDYHVGLITGQKLVTYSLRLPEREGNPALVVWANIDLEWLARHFTERFPSAEMTLLLADRKGTILARLPDPDKWVGKFIGEAYLPLLHSDSEGVIDIIGVDGVERIIAYAPAAASRVGFYLGVGLSKAPYFAPIDAASRQKVILISLSFVLALGAAWFGGDAFIRNPIDRLLGAARRWREGDFAARTGLTDIRSEIGALGQAFDEMAEAVQGRDRLRHEAQEQLARLNTELEGRVRDEVAERERAQAALIQAQKIEAVGQLTSGVAHDFNNLLAAVLGSLDLIRMRVADPAIQRIVDTAHRAAERGARLTEQLLAFSRHRHIEPKPFDLNNLITEMSDLLERTLGPSITVKHNLAPGLWPVLADASQIEVALLNLAINARDAMARNGTLTIETANLAAADKRLPRPGLAGDFVSVSVHDTGTGMPEDVKRRAFEPFYTTKEVGKGSGLGLSMVYGVAKQTGGTATIDSTPGQGTTVTLFLPRSAERMPDAAVPGRVLPANPHRGTRRRILVVDDDSDVRDVTVSALSESGFEPIAVENGLLALELVENGQEFDAGVVDYAMPGLNGAEVIARLRDKHPKLPIILVSGYVANPLAADLPEDVAILRKPFRVGELLDRVEQALAATAAMPAGGQAEDG